MDRISLLMVIRFIYGRLSETVSACRKLLIGAVPASFTSARLIGVPSGFGAGGRLSYNVMKIMAHGVNRYGPSGNLAFADRAVHHAVIRAVLCAGRLHAVFLDRFAGRMPRSACKIADDRFFARAADIRRISALMTGGCGHDALAGVYAVHRKVRVFGRKRHRLRRIGVLIPHCTQTLIVLEKRNLNGSVGSTDRLGLKSDLRQHACGTGYIGGNFPNRKRDRRRLLTCCKQSGCRLR